jgi:hypothetical protein
MQRKVVFSGVIVNSSQGDVGAGDPVINFKGAFAIDKGFVNGFGVVIDKVFQTIGFAKRAIADRKMRIAAYGVPQGADRGIEITGLVIALN